MINVDKKKMDKLIKLTNGLNEIMTEDGVKFITLNNIVIYFDFYEINYYYADMQENDLEAEILLFRKNNEMVIPVAIITYDSLKNMKFLHTMRLKNEKWENSIH